MVTWVAALLKHAADPDLHDTSGRSAANWAREQGHTEVLALLEPQARPHGP